MAPNLELLEADLGFVEGALNLVKLLMKMPYDLAIFIAHDWVLNNAIVIRWKLDHISRLFQNLLILLLDEIARTNFNPISG